MTVVQSTDGARPFNSLSHAPTRLTGEEEDVGGVRVRVPTGHVGETHL